MAHARYRGSIAAVDLRILARARLLPGPRRPVAGLLRGIRGAAAGYWLMTALDGARSQLPTVAAGPLGLAAVGGVGFAGRISAATMLVPMAVRATLLPRLAASWRSDRAAFAAHLGRASELVALVAVPGAIGGAGLAGPLVLLLLGPGYEAYATPVAIAGCSAAIIFLGIQAATALIAAEQVRWTVVAQLPALAVLAALLPIAAPAAGITGILAGDLASRVAGTVVTHAALAARCRAPGPLRILLVAGGVLAAGTGMVLAAPAAARPVTGLVAAGLGAGLLLALLPDARSTVIGLVARVRLRTGAAP